jgi:hypothetical protein
MIRSSRDGITWFRSSRSMVRDRSIATRSILTPANSPGWFGHGPIGSIVIAKGGGGLLQGRCDHATYVPYPPPPRPPILHFGLSAPAKPSSQHHWQRSRRPGGASIAQPSGYIQLDWNHSIDIALIRSELFRSGYLRLGRWRARCCSASRSGDGSHRSGKPWSGFRSSLRCPSFYWL